MVSATVFAIFAVCFAIYGITFLAIALTGANSENTRAHGAQSPTEGDPITRKASTTGSHDVARLPSDDCPEIHELELLGRQNLNFLNSSSRPTSLDTIENVNIDIYGGCWGPVHCHPRQQLAIIIPFRNRTDHLVLWLKHMLPILKRQMLHFCVIVVEQDDTGKFNKGRLYNAAFGYALTLNITCVIFHDVDMLAEDDRLPYDCADAPVHMGAYVNTLAYKLVYAKLAGGVLALTPDQYKKINGFSNEYWGWGGEDDDIAIRLLETKLNISRPRPHIGRYTMIQHNSRSEIDADSARSKNVYHAKDNIWLSGLSQPVWSIERIRVKKLFHHLWVNVRRDPTTPAAKRQNVTFDPHFVRY